MPIHWLRYLVIVAPNYQRHVDGIRCWAVLAVLIFHGFPHALPGGFVGVDVFFVISGYLISGIIFRELEAGIFHFSTFYARRFRRLLPAFLIMTLTVSAVSYFIFLPDEMASFGKHLMGAASFMTNLLLWKEAGYFDHSANTKPFLHLWSLGVEEQFYLFWPLFLFLTYKIWNRLPKVPIIVFLVASLILNVTQINHDASSVFFGMTTRLWQFAAGSLLIFIPSRKVHLENIKLKIVYEFLALVGILSILITCVKYSEKLSYPGWWALVPTISTALLIYFGGHSKICKIILENSLAVGIGLISYPLYLWHWPLLSILHITEVSQISNFQITCALILSFVLAFVTYRFIEKPIQSKLNFKDNKKLSQKTVGFSLALLSVVFLIGFTTYENEGFPYRLESNGLSKMSFLDPHDILTKRNKNFGCPSELKNLPFGFCRQKLNVSPDTAVWGDSLSLAIQLGFEHYGHFPLLLEQSGCPTLANVQLKYTSMPEFCVVSNEEIMNYLLQNENIKTVIMVTLGAPYITGVRRGNPTGFTIQKNNESFKNLGEAYEYGLNKSLRRLTDAGKKVIIYAAHPEMALDILSPKDCGGARPFRFSKSARSSCDTNFIEYQASQANYWAILERQKALFASRVKVFYAGDEVCVHGICSIFRGGKSMYTDAEHLSADGGALMVDKMLSRYLTLAP